MELVLPFNGMVKFTDRLSQFSFNRAFSDFHCKILHLLLCMHCPIHLFFFAINFSVGMNDIEGHTAMVRYLCLHFSVHAYILQGTEVKR
jgi:hypothetical protein